MERLATTHSVAETIELGRKIGTALQPRDVIALVGRLGAGKTHLAKGLALGLGVGSDREVNSPTFVLINEYWGRLPIRHIDAYRLSRAEEFAALGVDEMLDAGSVVIVEWADRVAEAIPSDALWIEIEAIEESTRTFVLRTTSGKMGERVQSCLVGPPGRDV